MNIFLTGASGLLGSAFARAAARRGHRVTGTVGSFPGAIEDLATTLRLDLTQADATTSAVLEVFPDVIVNCAAVSMPEQCDADPHRSETLNVALPALLARLAYHVSARLIHISSDQVFDGARSRPYETTATPCPINLYGRQKLESEQAVQDGARDFSVVLRAPLLLGNSASGQRSHHERLFADWAAGRTPRLFVDEFRQPCTAENLAEVMVELGERNDLCGVFHWAGAALLSRYEIGCQIREHFRLTDQKAPLQAVKREEHAAVVRQRPPCLALALAPLAGKLKTRPERLAEQLATLNVPPACQDWYHRQ